MTSDHQKGRLSRLRKFLPLLLIAAVMVVLFSSGVYKQITLENLVINLDLVAAWIDARWLVALCLFILAYIVATAFSIPIGIYLTLGGGALFGGFWGGLAVVIGATLGATSLFFAIDFALRDFFRKKTGPYLAKLSEGFQRRPLNYMLTLRLIPVFPFWLVNIAPAVLGVRLHHYVIGTFFGLIPGTFAFAFIGGGFRDTLNAQSEAYKACEAAGTTNCTVSLNLQDLISPQLLAGLGLLAALSLTPALFQSLKSRREKMTRRK